MVEFCEPNWVAEVSGIKKKVQNESKIFSPVRRNCSQGSYSDTIGGVEDERKLLCW